MINREDMLALTRRMTVKEHPLPELQEVIWMKKDLVKEHLILIFRI